MTTDIIISTYNQPIWLDKVLCGYCHQTYTNFEIIIADDGSGEDTKKIIEKYNNILKITHVWHEDKGFRKTEILNKAVKASKADYLIFTDGDCIPRKDFVQVHYDNAQKGYFISGGYFKMTMPVSKSVTLEDIASQKVFYKEKLIQRGQPKTFKMHKLTKRPWVRKLLNAITTTKPTFNGCNASVFREDCLEVNGFTESMKYGAEDREFGTRLENLGRKGKQLRYSAILLHLDHNRGYRNKEDLAKNKAIWTTTKKKKLTWAKDGLIKEN